MKRLKMEYANTDLTEETDMERSQKLTSEIFCILN